MIYSGLGILAIAIYASTFILVWLAMLFLTGEQRVRSFSNLWICLIACTAAALAVWFIGRWMNKLNPLQVLEFTDGERRIVSRPRHTIYTLEMEYWGIIFGCITFFAIVGKKIGLF